MYKLRSNVQLSVEEENEVYAIISAERPGNGALPDPRHNHMGYRSFMQPEKIEEAAFDVWDRHRIRLCVPDGSRDMQLEKSTLLESNIDKLNGLSFKKGCYMGQEITARMHFRGLAKKHLYAVESDGPLPHADETIIVNEKLAGAMRSSNGHIGIALLKDDMTDNLESIGMRLITPQSPPEET